jgi:hypothetical protein
MRHKLFIGLFFGVISLSLLGACASSPPPSSPEPEKITETRVPITTSIIERIKLSKDNIGKIQFYNFGRVALEREATELRQKIDEGNLIFEDVHITEQIILGSQTPGEGIDLQSTEEGMLLVVSFDDKGIEYQLRFTKFYDEADPYFYLGFEPNNKMHDGDEKGSLVYNKEVYKVKYSGEKPPFLLINLEQTDIEQRNPRTLRGRKVPAPSNSGQPGPVSPPPLARSRN